MMVAQILIKTTYKLTKKLIHKPLTPTKDPSQVKQKKTTVTNETTSPNKTHAADAHI